MSDEAVFVTRSEEETRRLAACLASRLQRPCILLLSGDLGSGKTAFVKGIIAGLEGDPADVHSPTFSLVNQYSVGIGHAIHIDLYRLEEAREQYSIGLDEILAGEDLVVIEWAENLHLAVPEAVSVRIQIEGSDRRRISIEPAFEDLGAAFLLRS